MIDKNMTQQTYIQIPLVGPGLRGGFSTRRGGVSSGDYSRLNLRFTSEDDAAKVEENYNIFLGDLGFTRDQVVLSDQVHGAEILQVTREHRGMGFTKEMTYQGVDGLVTQEKNVVLMTQHADCIPVYFYDKIKSVIGLAHGGWQGTLQGITGHMIKKMRDLYGCDVKDLQVYIGPGICQDCYEVSPALIKQFKEKYPQEKFYKGRYLDLKGLHKYQCMTLGLEASQVVTTQACTACDVDMFYSHRRDGNKRGGHVAYMVMDS